MYRVAGWYVRFISEHALAFNDIKLKAMFKYKEFVL